MTVRSAQTILLGIGLTADSVLTLAGSSWSGLGLFSLSIAAAALAA